MKLYCEVGVTPFLLCDASIVYPTPWSGFANSGVPIDPERLRAASEATETALPDEQISDMSLRSILDSDGRRLPLEARRSWGRYAAAEDPLEAVTILEVLPVGLPDGVEAGSESWMHDGRRGPRRASSSRTALPAASLAPRDEPLPETTVPD